MRKPADSNNVEHHLWDAVLAWGCFEGTFLERVGAF